MSKKIGLRIEDKIAYVQFGLDENCRMTVFDQQTMRELQEIVDGIKAMGRKKLKGVVFHSMVKDVFVAGADIGLIERIKDEEEAIDASRTGHRVFNEIEDLQIPTVACIDGVCLGGGLEMALAADSILVSDSKKTQLGFPEVQLGILPAWGGTYRLPRLLGLDIALDLILSAKRIDGKKAKKIGLADEVVPAKRLLEISQNFLQKKRRQKKRPWKKILKSYLVNNFLGRKLIFQNTRNIVLKRGGGRYLAPLKILDMMEKAQDKGRKKYLELEAKAFGALCLTDQARNLRSVFFMMEDAKKYPRNGQGQEGISKLERGAVLGSGTMGGGISWLMASHGMRPLLKDLDLDSLGRGLEISSGMFSNLVSRKKISPSSFERQQRSITPVLNYDTFERVNVVVEAVNEDLELKGKLLRETEEYTNDDCIITTNTSSLSVSEMAQKLERPSNFAGLHFFNPVNRMPLVEIVTHDSVAERTIESLHKWCVKIKKTPIIVKDSPGFVVNRILVPYLNEACFLLEEGIPLHDIDRAALEFGMPMGPFRLLDEVGLDIAMKALKSIHDRLGERFKPSEITRAFVAGQIQGRNKGGEGFYIYDEKGNQIAENSRISSFTAPTNTGMDSIQIQKRLILPMVNESSLLLEQKIVNKVSDIDLAVILGIGFPPYRGGILKYADSLGLHNIYNTLVEYSEQVSADRYRPAEYLKKLADNGQTFYGVENDFRVVA